MLECVTLSLKSSSHIPLLSPSSILPTAKMRYASYSNFLSVSPSPLSLSALRIPHRTAQPSTLLSWPHPGSSLFFFSRPPSHLISHLCSTSTSGAHTQTLCGSMSPYLFWRIRRAVPGSGVCGHISGVIRELLPLSPVQPPCEL